MDLLEYQGKQLFARHGVPVPSGAPATTVEEAVAAADEIGYPCVVKAQVQIGGRGKAGGIKVAQGPRGGRGARARPSSAWTSAATRSTRCGSRRRRTSPSEYYASIVFDRSAKRPLVMLSTQGGMDIEEVADTNPDAIARLHVDPLLGFQDFHARRLAFEAGVDADVVRPIGALLTKLYDAFVNEEAMLVEVNPLIVTRRPQGRRARREGDARRQLALPPPRQRRAAQHRRRGRAGADGARARPDVRQARRQRRHPRQRRRAW